MTSVVLAEADWNWGAETLTSLMQIGTFSQLNVKLVNTF
jgi:hypothetical protein